MIFDSQAQFSNKQNLAQVAATYNSTNVIKIEPNSAWGNPLNILVQVTEAFLSAGAATVQVILQTSTVEAMTSPVTLFDSGAIAKALLVPGYQFALNFLPNGNLQYLRVTYTIGTATTTAGKITSGFLETVQTNNKTFPAIPAS